MQANKPKTWPDVETIFNHAGISYEQKDWFYLCHIKGGQFYYSPQTGKWRVKGKRAWKKSSSPQDFLHQAFKYTPPKTESQQSSSQNSQSKQEKQKNNHKSKSKSNQKTERKTTDVDEIREDFQDRFGYYLELQRESDYKIGWIWYKLIEEFLPTQREICWLSVVFNYSPYWAVHQIRDFYASVAPRIILTIIELNRERWLYEFQQRWGQSDRSQQEQRQSDRERTNQYRQQQRERYQRYQQRQRDRYNQNYHQHHHSGDRYSAHSFLYRNYLDLLRITFPFTKQELKSAYRKRALETHPDSGGTSEAFRQVNTAYEVLSRHVSG